MAERQTDQGVQPYKFGGKELDRTNNLDLYDFEARAFDPVLMRFTRPDPMAGKYPWISMYAYCGNNPVNAIDPTGMDWVYHIVDGNTEVYYDRDVKSQDDVNKKYGEKSGITHLGDGATLTSYDKDGNVTSQYTFTNDAKENKYGTVTDMNGNVMDNSQITYGSNYTIFGTSDNSVNAETLHKNWLESYIGPNNPKDYLGKDSYQYFPRSLADQAAYYHDLNYDKIGAKGFLGALFNIRAFEADRDLLKRCINIINNPNSTAKDVSEAKKIIALFTPIAAYKNPLNNIMQNTGVAAMKNYSPALPYAY